MENSSDKANRHLFPKLEETSEPSRELEAVNDGSNTPSGIESLSPTETKKSAEIAIKMPDAAARNESPEEEMPRSQKPKRARRLRIE